MIMTSILIYGSAVFMPCLLIMVALAQGLPVALIPEQFLLTSVRHLVVDDRCFNVLSIFQALHTQRMYREILLAGFLPFAAIAALCR